METQSSAPPTPPAARRAPTIHDVAAALGIHKSTVSLGLSGKGNVSERTRARIEAVAKEMGYEPNPLAQRLANNSRNNLVYLCAGNLDVGITTEKLLLIQKELARNSFEAPIYTLSTSPTASAEERSSSQSSQIRHFCRQQPRAIVCSAYALHDEVYKELAAYQETGGIVIAYDVAIPLDCDQVIFDREHNAYLAAKYLIDHGHQRLGLALSTLKNPLGERNSSQIARLNGFKRALREAGLELREEWIFEESNYEPGGAHLAERFLSLSKRPTGLCIVNDYMALGFMAQILRAGLRIPEDVSVLGHDNQPVAAYCPVPLTTATQPIADIAHKVSELLEERLNGSRSTYRVVTLRGEIIERQSVATLNH